MITLHKTMNIRRQILCYRHCQKDCRWSSISVTQLYTFPFATMFRSILHPSTIISVYLHKFYGAATRQIRLINIIKPLPFYSLLRHPVLIYSSTHEKSLCHFCSCELVSQAHEKQSAKFLCCLLENNAIITRFSSIINYCIIITHQKLCNVYIYIFITLYTLNLVLDVCGAMKE